MHDQVYQTGNTVRLTCKFFDFNDELSEPQIVKVKLYNERYNVISEFANIQRDDEGNYYLDYTIEDRRAKFYYEWYAEIDGTPSLKRSSFTTAFI